MSGTVLLFTNTRDESEYLGSILKKQNEIPIDVHHGSLSREIEGRNRAEVEIWG